MRKDLKDIIQRFNDIQYPNNEGKSSTIFGAERSEDFEMSREWRR